MIRKKRFVNNSKASCATCSKILPHDSFHKSKYEKNGLNSNCKKCRKLKDYNNRKDKRNKILSNKNFEIESFSGEIWEFISGYDGIYMVSNFARVKSCLRLNPSNNKVEKAVLRKIRTTPAGYNSVRLHKKGKGRWFMVHRLVAEAFISNSKNKPQVNHLNGIKTDNRIENLEWCTGSENSIHAIRSGLKEIYKGEQVKNSKLTRGQVIAVKRLKRINPKVTQKDIAAKLGVHQVTIHKILRKKSWKHI